MLIRPFNPETDWEGLVAITNQVNPLPVSAADARRRDEQAPPSLLCRRLVAVDDASRITGVVTAVHAAYLPEGLFNLRVVVDKAHRNRGIGCKLFEAVLPVVREAGGRELEGPVRDSHPEALQWAQRRGFRIRRHAFASTLNLSTFDETPFVGTLESVKAAGFRFFTLADLPDTEEHRRRLYELDKATTADIPSNKWGFSPFEEYQKMVFEADWYAPDGQIIAADGDRWVGMAALGIHRANGVAYHNMTGVLGEYRGQGLASALKLLSIRAAQGHGMRAMRTNNDAGNSPMLAVNRKFGYVPEPGDYFLIREHV